MKTTCFEAVVNVSPAELKKKGLFPFPVNLPLIIRGKKVPVSFSFYSQEKEAKGGKYFITVRSSQPLFLKWKDEFKLQKPDSPETIARGRVLNPEGEIKGGKKENKIISHLEQLDKGKKEMILALAKKKGIKGLGEKELVSFSSLPLSVLFSLCKEMEGEGKIKIVRFSPLYIITQSSFNFLLNKILKLLQQYHRNHPHQTGLLRSRINKRWGVHSRVFSLALKHLLNQGKIKEIHDRVALFQFEPSLPPQDEKILEELERMCAEGEFKSLSRQDLKKKFSLSSQKLNNLLSLLIQRRKIIQGPEGFIIHSPWLNDIIRRIRGLDKRELSVGEFKKMTGLSRKYVIPLLELLDQMGITRRKGAVREIL